MSLDEKRIKELQKSVAGIGKAPKTKSPAYSYDDTNWTTAGTTGDADFYVYGQYPSNFFMFFDEINIG